MEGKVILIDKPFKWTSFDVVKKVKNLLKEKKVGHAGTLDPLATGLLVLCTGKMTKRIQYIQDEEKEYTGEITFGHTTPSFDKETEPDGEYPVNHITAGLLRAGTQHFLGTTEQYPPSYSALKIQGERAYNKARRGERFAIKPRNVFIKEFVITEVALPAVKFRVVCSKGTYIRSLAHDLGKKIGSGAYLSELKRTRIGSYKLCESQNISDLKSKNVEEA